MLRTSIVHDALGPTPPLLRRASADTERISPYGQSVEVSVTEVLLHSCYA